MDLEQHISQEGVARDDLIKAASLPGILTDNGRSKHNVRFKIADRTVQVILGAPRRVKRNLE